MSSAQQPATVPDALKPAEAVFHRKGTFRDGVLKFTWPRSDVSATIGGTPLRPAAAMISWVALRQADKGVVADGDLVLLASELGAVENALLSRGVRVTGVHNHLVGEKPELVYIHFFANDDVAKVAQALEAALETTAIPRGEPKPSTAKPSFDVAELESILGAKANLNGDVAAFSFARHHEIRMAGQALPPSMGMATAINFQPAPQGAAATGDFVLQESEVQPVLEALLKNGITATAVHNHLLDDEPRMVFVHFWAEGKPADIARGLRAALDAAAAVH